MAMGNGVVPCAQCSALSAGMYAFIGCAVAYGQADWADWLMRPVPAGVGWAEAFDARKELISG
jgi:hypothetical protein